MENTEDTWPENVYTNLDKMNEVVIGNSYISLVSAVIMMKIKAAAF